jgi:hypothetical protein
MKECVVIEGYMKGACSNCWKNSKQATCIYCKYSCYMPCRYIKLIRVDKDSSTKKRSHNADDDTIDLTSDAAGASAQTLSLTPKRRKTVSITIPSASESASTR